MLFIKRVYTKLHNTKADQIMFIYSNKLIEIQLKISIEHKLQLFVYSFVY